MSDTTAAKYALRNITTQVRQMKKLRKRVNAGHRAIFDARIEVIEKELEVLDALMQPRVELMVPNGDRR